MNSFDDKERELRRKEQEIKAKEAEIRLRELELEVNREQDRVNAEVPHYQTRKHQEPPSSLAKLSGKIAKVGKFIGFTIFTIAVMKVGLTVGMWLAYGLLTTAIVFIGYQIFMKDND